MAHAKIPLPKIFIDEVDRLLEACVRPSSKDPSLLEIRRELVPPLLLPPALRALGGTSRHISDEQLRFPRAEWANLFAYLSAIAEEVVMEAEFLALADRGPSASDLEQALLADPWVAGRNSSRALCLIGLRPCGRHSKQRKPFSATLKAVDVRQGWALTIFGWHRLGQRISGPAFQELRPRYSNLREYGDEEIESTLLADRERVARQLERLMLPPA